MPRSSRLRRLGLAAGCVVLAVAAVAAYLWLSPVTPTEAAAPARWGALGGEIATSFTREQNRNGTFRDYIADLVPGPSRERL